jgi:proteasome accessory factor C
MARTSSSERARRLLALLPLLRRGGAVPLAELASAVGATTAQVAADIATLSMCGLPPYSPDELVDVFVDGDVVRTFSEPPALGRPLRLTPAEARALAAALEGCGRGADDPLVRKLLDAAAPSSSEDPAVLRAALADDGLARVHATVAAATASHEALRIEYFSAGRGERSCRVIEPWAMGVDRGAWYVSAWCRSAGGERVFRLDRVVSAEPTGEHFTPPEGARPPVPAVPATGRLPKATVRFRQEARDDLSSREWPGTLFRTEPGDDIVGEVPYASKEWVARRVVARLGEAEVQGPAEVRDAVADLAQRTLDELG